jgi:Na+(H+)/acetate symporter ActP
VNQAYTVPAVAVVVVATVLIGALGLRISRTTSDFLVASRTVRPVLNAAAISGEYLSAASFLGIAGLVLVQGPDMLWYPVGYTAGYLVLLVLVAAPLRRSGAYTLPDFAEGRLESRRTRRIASAFVVTVGWLYLVPQLQGAGLTLAVVTRAPHWFGGLLVAVVVTLVVSAGGMRSITFVQAFQYWLKLTALFVPAVFLVIAWHAHGAPRVSFDRPVILHHATRVEPATPLDLDLHAPLRIAVTGTVDGHRYTGRTVELPAGRHLVGAGARLTFPAGSRMPWSDVTPDDGMSGSPATGGEQHPLYSTYGLIIATLLGTMGLPHVVVRFYTSPNGRAARRTTVAVLALIGVFYLLPPLYGALARMFTPELSLTGDSDAAVLVLPARMIGGVGGELLGALLAGGAFAAFLATASGVTLAVSGVLTQDVLPWPGGAAPHRVPRPRGGRPPWSGRAAGAGRPPGSGARSRSVRRFRLATVLAMAVPLLAQAVVGDIPVADSVGMAFAVSASAFCPLLVLGIWWRGLTPQGAVAGLLAGGGSALASVALTIAGRAGSGWGHSLLEWPAVWSVPVGFLAMILVSLATRGSVPEGTGAVMARLHLPEDLRDAAVAEDSREAAG